MATSKRQESARRQRQEERERVSSVLSVRITSDLMQQLEASADQLGVSLSEVVRYSCALGLPAAHDAIASAIEDAQGTDIAAALDR